MRSSCSAGNIFVEKRGVGSFLCNVEYRKIAWKCRATESTKRCWRFYHVSSKCHSSYCTAVLNSPAVCRARWTSLHRLSVVKVWWSTDCLSTIDTRPWLIRWGSGDDAFLWRTDERTSCFELVSIVGRLYGAHVFAASAPRELISDSDCVLGLLFVHAAFRNLCMLSVNIDHATRKRIAIKNVVEPEMLSTWYMLSAGTAMRDLFALPADRISFGFCYVWICRGRIDE